MLKLNSLLLAILCLNFVAAQNVNLINGQELANEYDYSHWDQALGQDDSGFYTIGKLNTNISNEKVVLKKFAPDLTLIYAQDVEASIGTFGDSKYFEDAVMHNGKLYAFYRGWNKQERQASLLVRMINPQTGQAEGNFTQLESEFGRNQMKSPTFSFSFSPDGSKILVLTEKPFEKKQAEELRLQVFNTSDFSSLWKNDLVLENEYKRARFNEIVVNNNGVAYLLKDFNESQQEHLYSLITTGADGSQTVSILLPDFLLDEKKVSIDANGNLFVGAILSDIPKKVSLTTSQSNWQGLWVFKAGEDGKIIQNKIHPMDAPELASIDAIQKAQCVGGKNTFELKDVLVSSTNEIIFLIEHTTESSTHIANSSPMAYEYQLSHKGVYTVAFDANNAFKWSQFLEKNQEEKTLDTKLHYGSFAYTYQNDKLYLVWNFMDLKYDNANRFRYWIDANGQKINIDNIYGNEALYPTLLTVIDKNGQFEYANRTFGSLPLQNIQQGNSFKMAVNPATFFPVKKGIILFSQLAGGTAKRYKLSKLTF